MNTIQKLDSLNEAHVTNMELACTDMRIRLSTTYDELRSRYQMESTEQKVLRKKLEFRFSKVTPKLTFGDYEMQSHEYEIVFLHQPLPKYSMSDTVRTNTLEAALLETTHTYQT